MLKPLNFTPPPEHVTLQAEIDRAEIDRLRTELAQAITDHRCACVEYTRLRELLTEANTEILYWRKNAQHWNDKACPDRTKPFTVEVNHSD